MFPSRALRRTARLAAPVMAAAVALLVADAPSVRAHPAPDVPVRAFFDDDGTAVVKIEVDVRCFAENPVEAPDSCPQALACQD